MSSKFRTVVMPWIVVCCLTAVLGAVILPKFQDEVPSDPDALTQLTADSMITAYSLPVVPVSMNLWEQAILYDQEYEQMLNWAGLILNDPTNPEAAFADTMLTRHIELANRYGLAVADSTVDRLDIFPDARVILVNPDGAMRIFQLEKEWLREDFLGYPPGDSVETQPTTAPPLPPRNTVVVFHIGKTLDHAGTKRLLTGLTGTGISRLFSDQRSPEEQTERRRRSWR